MLFINVYVKIIFKKKIVKNVLKCVLSEEFRVIYRIVNVLELFNY